jgi:hypothetical protein
VARDFPWFGIAIDPGVEPTETRRFVFKDWRPPSGDDVSEAFFGYGNPDATNQIFGAIKNGYLHASPHIAFDTINDANVISQIGVGRAFRFGESKPVDWRVKPVAHRERFKFPIAATTSPSVIHGAPLATLRVS